MSSNERMDLYEDQSELIDISAAVDDMWKGLKRFWLILLIILVVCGGLFYGVSRFAYVPVYTAYATYTVSVSGNDVYTNRFTTAELGKTMDYVLTSKVLQTMVAEDMGVGSVPGQVSVTVMEDTNLFTINVESSDPQNAYNVLQTVIADYPKVSEAIIGVTDLELMDESGVPAAPSNAPDYTNRIELGLLIGVAIDLIILIIYAATRHTIQKEEDFKKYLSVECFGVVPKARFKRRGKNATADSQLVLLNNPKVPAGYREAMRTVRSRLERKVREKDEKVIIVSSAIPGEGKSTVAANIAVGLAMTGKSVILVDLDLRNPSLSSVMNMQSEKGGTIDVLRGRIDWKEVAVPYKDTKLRMILGGKPVNNTSRTLSGSNAQALIEELRGEADYIILDTPPCAILSDATIAAEWADAAVFVVRQDYARTDRIMEGIRNLAETGIDICGCILNQAQVGVTGYGYSGSYGYGRYGYGYGSKKYGYGYGGYGYGEKKEK